jgi:hypothetical protein
MRLQQYIGRDDPLAQFRMLADMTGVLVRTHVPPRPAVKAALVNRGDVVGHEVVTEAVAFIDGGPQLTGARINGQPRWVSDSRGINAHMRAIGVKGQDICAIPFRWSRVRVVYIRS